jgi:hypothetical protein
MDAVRIALATKPGDADWLTFKAAYLWQGEQISTVAQHMLII